MRGVSKQFREHLVKLRDELIPGLQFEHGSKHIVVTCEGKPGRVLVSCTTKNFRGMLNHITRIKRRFYEEPKE